MPEDWTQPHGRMVQLAVVLFKSTLPNPAPDPVIYLTGGPGTAALAITGRYGRSWQQVFGNRDLILVDQRGTGVSKPSLACPEVATWTLQTVQRCHDRLAHAGVDLSAYTALSDAADIAALRLALGYKTVDLYGLSYGARLALTLMRLYPAHVRSIILDSVFPPQENWYTQRLMSEGHIFSLIVTTCAADHHCSTAYPHLAATFISLIKRLNAHPAAIHVTLPTKQTVNASLNGDDLWGVVFGTLYSSTENRSIPRMIVAASRGDYAMVGSAVAGGNDPTFSWGLNLSWTCSEDAPYASPAQIRAAAQALPAVLRDAEVSVLPWTLQACRIWHVAPVPAWQKTAVHSSIPTLILTGQFDPIAPPSLGRLAAETLSRSFFFTFPIQGHGQLVASCPVAIVAAFLQNPTKKPDASCIVSMPALTFD